MSIVTDCDEWLKHKQLAVYAAAYVAAFERYVDEFNRRPEGDTLRGIAERAWGIAEDEAEIKL